MQEKNFLFFFSSSYYIIHDFPELYSIIYVLLTASSTMELMFIFN